MNTSLTPQPQAIEPGTAAESTPAVVSTAALESAAPASADVATAAADAVPASAAAPVATPAAAAIKNATAPSPRTLLKQLQTQFPAFRDFLPLSIGIDKQILAQLPELDRKTMRTALGIHTGSLRYLKVMEKAKVRHDLDGTAGAEVTDVHRAHATQVLQDRFKKEAERKKAERDAAAADEAARLHAEKLSQLTAKFSRK